MKFFFLDLIKIFLKMNSERYPMLNYVPINPTKRLNTNNFKGDLHSTLQKMKYNKIISDLDYHFQNCYISNFDIIHHECRGDKLSHDRRHYETIFKKNIDDEINSDDVKYHFISSAIKSERKDIAFERRIFKEHFSRENLEKKLEKKSVFLSSMKKRAYFKRRNKSL